MNSRAEGELTVTVIRAFLAGFQPGEARLARASALEACWTPEIRHQSTQEGSCATYTSSSSESISISERIDFRFQGKYLKPKEI